MKRNKPFRPGLKLMTVVLLLVASAFLASGRVMSGESGVIATLEDVSGGASQQGVPDITGAWNVKVTVTESGKDKKTVYEFGWVIRRIGDGWWVERMLLKTGNPNQKWMEGKTWNEYSLAFKDGVWEYRGKFGAKDQWAACTFTEDSFSCKGSQREFTITEEISISKGSDRFA